MARGDCSDVAVLNSDDRARLARAFFRPSNEKICDDALTTGYARPHTLYALHPHAAGRTKMSDLLERLRLRQPLPRGPYPTAKWPDGCTHLPQPTPPANPFTARRPDASKVTTVTLYGATHTVSVESGDDYPPYVDLIKLGGVWHSACDTLGEDFCKALDAQLQAEIAADRADWPHGVEA